MPPGFSLLDAALVSIPIGLALLGLIRGAPVELASCVGCVAGVAACWLVSLAAPLQALGQPAAPLIALFVGIVVWRLARGLSQRLGLDSRWIDLGGLFDSAIGCVMGGLRGVAMVSAGCLAWAMIFVPMGWASPLQTVAYPVFLSVGSRATSATLAAAKSSFPALGDPIGASSLASVPLPFTMPQIAAAPVSAAPIAAAPMSSPAGPALAALIRTVAPGSAAAAMQPLPPRPVPAIRDIPVRGVPVSLMETHHNILHPNGTLAVHRVHR